MESEHGGPKGFSAVSNVLWRERQLLDLLLFKLEEEQLVLASGKSRWLPHATREVETVLEEIRRNELERAVELETSMRELELREPPTLRKLTELAPEPWSSVFDEHRRALLELVQEIDGVARSNRDLLHRGQQVAREALRTIEAVGPDTYSDRGAAKGGNGTLGLVNEAI